ncbi:MAG: nucleotidyltransferase [Fusobacteria bacterium]|nr:nucleotidyltransferase [Fusobacteriota bacterium]
MRSTGIIVEYNPFHNGHKYHIERAKEIVNNDLIIAVMSGNYVQRGNFAFLDKWSRTEMALLNGVDLILELPSLYSAQSAEIFSTGAVAILDKIGVDNIIFGSEIGDINKLTAISNYIMENKEKLDILILNNMKNGISYPNAFNLAINSFNKNFNFTPNNILGIEYLKSLKKIDSHIKPHTIKREKSNYNDKYINEGISSATAIREYLLKGEDFINIKGTIPENTYKFYENYSFLDNYMYYNILKYKIIINKNSLENIQDLEDGFHNRLYSSAVKYDNYTDFYNSLVTKRLTKSRLNRILLHIILDITIEKTELAKKNYGKYIRVLGFNNKGKQYLNYIKKDINIEIITNIKKNYVDSDLDFIVKNEINADEIYNIFSKSKIRKIPIYFEK